MNVLGVIGSPRKRGNTDVLVGEILRGAEAGGARVEKVYLNDLNIRWCQGCAACKTGGGYTGCIWDDDMTGLYEKLIAADALVLGCPIYCFGPTAQMKTFIDRWYALLYKENGRRHSMLNGKPMVLALVYGDPDPFVSGAANAYGTFRDQAAYCGLTIASVIYGTAVRPGEIRGNRTVMEQAYESGKQLVTFGLPT